jgi:hypothetical protein
LKPEWNGLQTASSVLESWSRIILMNTGKAPAAPALNLLHKKELLNCLKLQHILTSKFTVPIIKSQNKRDPYTIRQFNIRQLTFRQQNYSLT